MKQRKQNLKVVTLLMRIIAEKEGLLNSYCQTSRDVLLAILMVTPSA